jgi:hypothetical protein
MPVGGAGRSEPRSGTCSAFVVGGWLAGFSVRFSTLEQLPQAGAGRPLVF